MFKNNLKIAFRNFNKNKVYGLINIFGLAIGLVATFLILIYVQHELSFDKFLPHTDSIYQINVKASFGGDIAETTNTPPPVGNALAENFPEIATYTRLYRPGDLIVAQGDQYFTEGQAWAVDSNFLQFFEFPLIEGDASRCLNGTSSIVLTASVAQKYFGTTPALGKELKVADEIYQVTGILADLPKTSSLQFDLLLPVSAMGRVKRFSWSWVWLQMETYVKTNTPLNTEKRLALEAKFPPMVRQQAASAFQRIGQNIDDFFEQGNQWALALNPFKEVHLHSAHLDSRMETRGNVQDVFIIGMVGLMILLLACINFMNLSTARSLSRAKEVGVRKVLGSNRRMLIRQFMTEALLYSSIAAIIAILTIYIVLPSFGELVGIPFEFTDLLEPSTLVAIISIPILSGLLAGAYPSLVLSGFKPTAILKSNFSKAPKGSFSVRSSLVVFQFAISVALVISTLIVLQQVNYSLYSDIGIQRDNILVINNVHRLDQQAKTFKETLLNFPEVSTASLTTDLPAGGYFGDFYVPDADENNQGLVEDLTLGSYLVDADFMPTMGIELLEGRHFNEELGTDSTAVILNEAAVKTVGWKNPIGKWITYPGGNNQRFQVVGVMKNFNSFSFRNTITPFALFHESSKSYSLGQQFLAVRTNGQNNAQLLAKAQETWQSFNPAAPLTYSFLDENFSQLYQAEQRLGSILTIFTLLSVLIACLGLFGLIAYATQQRSKEIGIRKVLGASVGNIVALLSKDFLKLVFIALLIASPIAWYVMQGWLENYAYHIEIQWWIFAVAGFFALGIAFLTLGFQSAKAALNNPVKAIQNE